MKNCPMVGFWLNDVSENCWYVFMIFHATNPIFSIINLHNKEFVVLQTLPDCFSSLLMSSGLDVNSGSFRVHTGVIKWGVYKPSWLRYLACEESRRLGETLICVSSKNIKECMKIQFFLLATIRYSK